MGQYKTLNNFAPEFSTSSTYSAGDLVMYQGLLYVCVSPVTNMGSWTGATNWMQTNIKNFASKVIANPVLTGNEPEWFGLSIDGNVVQEQKLYQTDGVKFSIGSDSDYTIENSYSSYCRIDKTIIMVLSCDITKNANVNAPITLGTFTNFPANIFAKLVGGAYLDEEPTYAYEDGFYTGVDAPTALVKGSNNDIALSIDTSNMVQGTTYHIRHMSVFLLTDNLIVDPVLDNNDWETIASICKAGNASAYWAVGDTKTDVGTDGYTRYYRIADMSGLYGKHVVFEQYTLDGADGSGASGMTWNATANNGYSTSTMRTTHLPVVILRYSSELQAQLENTSYQVCKGGNDGTLVTLSDKLFLPAAKELSTSPSYSRTEENNALTTFQYYQTHNTQADRIKYKNGDLTSAGYYWTRSPRSGNTNYVVRVINGGDFDFDIAYFTYRVSPCFAW